MNNLIITLLAVLIVLVIMVFVLLDFKFNMLSDRLGYLQREQQNHNDLLQITKETLQQYKDLLEFIKEGEQNNSDRYIKILELMNDLTQIIPNQITGLQNELNKEQNNKDNE